METANRSRGQIKRRFSERALELTQACLSPDASILQLKTLLAQTDSKWTALNAIYDQILTLLSEVTLDQDTEARYDEIIEERETLRDEMVRIRVEAEEAIQGKMNLTPPTVPIMAIPPPQNVEPPRPRARVKLPKLEIKPFDGSFLEWMTFWDSFNASIHADPDLADVQKFNYLRGYLRGKAFRAVEGLPLTSDAYAKAVQVLHQQFGKPDIMIQSRMNQLYQLKDVRQATDDASLRQLYSSLIVNVRALEALGQDINAFGGFLVTILLHKIPSDLQLRWNRNPNRSATNLNALLTFIQNELNARDRCDIFKTEHATTKQEIHPKAPKATTTALTAEARKDGKPPCMFCSSNEHRSGKCALNREERKASLRKSGRCFICTKRGHRASDCGETGRCAKCKGNHHVFICGSDKRETSDGSPITTKCEPENTTTLISTSDSEPDGNAFLMTGLLSVHGPHGVKIGRVLFDSGSKLSYITTRISESVGLTSVGRERLIVSGFGGRSTAKTMRRMKAELGCFNDAGPVVQLEMYEIPKICDPIPRVSTRYWIERLQNDGLDLADDVKELKEDTWNGKIDLLIGAKDAPRVWTGKSKRLREDLIAIETVFGWMVMGGASGHSQDSLNTTTLLSLARSTQFEVNEGRITGLWELDAIGIENGENAPLACSQDTPDPLVEHFESTVRFENGRYCVQFPWREDHPELPTNRSLAENRLKGLLRKLRTNPSLLDRYKEQMEEHLRRGFVEEIPPELVNVRRAHYLPHHPVVRLDKTTTKVRPVFDASSGNPSLNDCLQSGPNLVPSLVAILMRFRQHAVALTADIEKAFPQLCLDESERDFVRYLWVKDPCVDPPIIKHLRWKRVVFGVTSSPFLLTATIRHHAKRFTESHPIAANKILDDMYVDDFISGAESVEAAERVVREVTDILGQAGLPIRRWTTNDADLQGTISDRQPAVPEIEISFSDAPSKVLGLVWTKTTDCFIFQSQPLIDFCQTFRENCTKRQILAASSRIFDPLGFISPVVIVPKLILQKLWLSGSGWDEIIPSSLANEWWNWVDSLQELPTISVPRHYFTGALSRPGVVQLHLFSDASEQAYGAVGYLRWENAGQANVTLLTSRTRVAPLKRVTLPRLELLGCTVAVRLSEFIQRILNIPRSATFYWTDSQVALAWILGPAHRWKTFVANRVQSIQLASEPANWRFVPGKHNPADLCSRGTSPGCLRSSSLWWSGPDWLSQSTDHWPKKPMATESKEAAQEFKTLVLAVPVASRGCFTPIFDVNRYGLLQPLLRQTAFILRAYGNVIAYRLGRPDLRREGELSANEVLCARRYWFRQLQRESFPEELEQLRASNTVKRTSNLAKFQPYLDKTDGLIKMRGRTGHSNELENSPDLPILPGTLFEDPRKPPHLIVLLVRDAHSKILHAKVKDTLGQLRQYCWILRGRQVVKKILRLCVTCNKEHRRTCQQTTAPLPSDRCSVAPPFDVTGIDFAGPFYLRDSNSKSWMCLFTCATTRAVHLELVRDLSTPCFLMAFNRFVSRRGVCRIVYSDNARTFKRASKELTALWKNMDSGIAREFCSRGITWRNIVEGAPWWGGWWERLVGMTKSLLKKTIGKAALSADELETVLTQAEAVLNSRPITFQYDDHQEPQPLCPADILIGRRSTALPPLDGSFDPEMVNARSQAINRARYREKIANDFWDRWTREYLQERAVHFRRRLQFENIRPGEVVLIKEDNVRRQNWQMGVVTEVFPGRDGVVRAVKLRTTKGELRRPVQRLCSLELVEDTEEASPPGGLATTQPSVDSEDGSRNEDNIGGSEEETGVEPSTRGEDVVIPPSTTRLGRIIRSPVRFGY